MSNNHMKRNRLIWGLNFLCALIFIVSAVFANSLSRFELMDGSVIQGEIQSFSKGVYRINSDALGTIFLPEKKIRAIKPAHSSGQADNSRQTEGSVTGAKKIDQMKDLLLSDPDTVRMIGELQSNPSVQQILQDKELMKAIAEGNLNRLGQDPKIKALMNDKTIGKILEQTQ
jgi:hypothetical protein